QVPHRGGERDRPQREPLLALPPRGRAEPAHPDPRRLAPQLDAGLPQAPARARALLRIAQAGTGVGSGSPWTAATTLRAARVAIASRVSTVAEPRCGRRTTFSSP